MTAEPAAAASAPRVFTGEELLALGDVGPCELIDGRIVTMTPTGLAHGIIESRLALEWGLFARERSLGWVLSGEVGVYTRRAPDRVRAADVALISSERAPASAAEAGYLEVAPEVVAEILSPGDAWQEVREKIEEYFAAGVQQVWIVEPRNRAVLIYTSPTHAEKYGPGDNIAGSGLLAGLSLSVASLFPF